MSDSSPYLENHPPRQRQFYPSRAKVPTGCIVVHTFEAPFGTSVDSGAKFIERRSDYGSYHSISDDAEWGQLGRYEWTMFSVRGHNSYTLNHSFMIRAEEWSRIDLDDRANLITQGAEACAAMARWMESEHGIIVPSIRLGLDEVTAGWPGFTSHAALDPSRRTDPGPDFPWDEFLAAYSVAMGSDSPVTGPPAVEPDKDVTALQGRLNHLGASLAVDGVFGPKTLAATETHLRRSVKLAAVETALRVG